MKEIFTLAILVVAAIFAATAFRLPPRQGSRAQQQAHLHIHSWLLQTFGLPFEDDAFGPRPPQAQGLGSLKSHRLLRLQTRLTPPDKFSLSYWLHASAVLQDEQRRYWLVLFDGRVDPSPAPGSAGMLVTWLRPPVRQRITELRARRALFNDAPAYRKAFGEKPTLAALTAFRKAHPEQEPQDD